MNDTVLSRISDPAIPQDLGWDLMQKIVDFDRLLIIGLNTGLITGHAGHLARAVLDQVATDLSAALMPEADHDEVEITYPNERDQSNRLLETGGR